MTFGISNEPSRSRRPEESYELRDLAESLGSEV